LAAISIGQREFEQWNLDVSALRCVPSGSKSRHFKRQASQEFWTHTDVEVAAVACEVVDAVRNDHAGRPTGEVVIERPEGLLRPDAALAEKLLEMLFGLGIYGKHGVSRGDVFGLPGGDPPELGVSIGVSTSFQTLLNLMSRQLLRFHPVLDDRRTDGRSSLGRHIGNLSRREVRPAYVRRVGIARSANFQN
jgi:hypothetical protein